MIGLGTFVFANPSEKSLDGNNNDVVEKPDDNEEVDKNNTNGKEEKEEEETEEVVEGSSTVLTFGQGQNTGVNNGTSGNSSSNDFTESNNAYLLALEALKKAEQSFLQTDLDSANKLIDDLEENKEELVNRAEVLQNVIDVETLVKELQKAVQTSVNIDDLNAARDYRDNKEIISNVNKLAESTKKQELLDILTEINLILDDTVAPIISGIENNTVTFNNVSLTVDDENVTVYINDTLKTLEDLKQFSENGDYVVKVVDSSFNETTLVFSIDKNKPTFDVVNGTHYDDSVTINVIDDYFDKVIITNQDTTLSWEELSNQFTLNDEGTYMIVAYDKANNASEQLWIAIDKSKPNILVNGTLVNGYYNDKEVTLEVKDKFLTEVTVKYNDKTEVFGKEDFIFESNNENGTFTKNYSDLGTYEVEAKDKFGHVTNYTFKIDNVAPVKNKIQLINNNNSTSTYIKKNDTLRVNFTTNEELVTMPTLTVGTEKSVTFEKVSGGNGEVIYQADIIITGEGLNEGILAYTISGYADIAGNIGEDLTEKDGNNTLIYDSVSPTVIVTYDITELTNGNVTATLTADEDIMLIDAGSWIPNDGYAQKFKKALHDNYYGKFKAVDRAGNEADVEVEVKNIDKEAPKMDYSTLAFEGTDKVKYDENGLNAYYMKNGDSVVFRIAFNEELKDVPTVTIGGQNVSMTALGLKQNNDGEDIYVYQGTFAIDENETEMAEGLLDIVLSNVVDKAGNVVIDENVLKQTPTSNKRVIKYDRDKIKEDWLYILNSDANNRKVIGNGQNLIVEAVFQEESITKPIVKIGKNQTDELECSWKDESDGWSSRRYVCRKTVKIDNSIAELEHNKEIPIEISNIKDKAGNETILTNANVVYTGDYGQVIFDGEAPNYQTLGILNITHYRENQNGKNNDILVANTGDTLRIMVQFDEKLYKNPYIVIGNMEPKEMYFDDAWADYYYWTDVEITNDLLLNDGEIDFSITGYSDAFNNVGEPLNKTYINHPDYKKVVLDTTPPTMDLTNILTNFEVGVDTYVYPQPGIVTDNVDGNISFSKVNIKWFKKNADGTKGSSVSCFAGNNWNTGLKNCELGTYIITYQVNDSAGNVTYDEKEMTLQDTTLATIIPDREDVTNFAQGVDIYNESGIAYDNYDDIDFSDINIDYYLKDNDGNETKQVKFQIGSNLADVPAGIYRINYWYIDSAGNTTSVDKTFNLKNIQSIEKVAQLVTEAERVMYDSSIDKNTQQHAIDYALQEANKLPNFEEKTLFLTKLNKLQSSMNNNNKYEEILGYYNKINEYLTLKDYKSAQTYIDIVKQQLPNLNNYEIEKENILTGVNKYQEAISNNNKYTEILGYYNKINEYLTVKDYDSAQKYIDIVKQQLPNLNNFEIEKENILTGVNKYQATINNNRKYEEILSYYNKAKEFLKANDYKTTQKYIDIVKQQLPNLNNYETEKENINKGIDALQKQLNELNKV